MALLLSFTVAPIVLGITDASAYSLASVPVSTALIPASETAHFNLRVLAALPGGPLPAGDLTVGTPPLAGELVRTVLYYGIDWGYSETDASQVALALWFAQDGVWRSPEHTVAGRIVEAATAASGSPSWNPGGRPVTSLVSQAIVSVNPIVVQPSSPGSFTGTATLDVRNLSTQDILVYLPYGTVFSAGTGSVVAWAVGSTVGQTQATTQPASTGIPTTQIPQSPSPTSTVELPPAPQYKGGYTPVSSPTVLVVHKAPPSVTPSAVASPVEPTPEPAATDAPIGNHSGAPAPPGVVVPVISPAAVEPVPDARRDGAAGAQQLKESSPQRIDPAVRSSAARPVGNAEKPQSSPNEVVAVPNPITPVSSSSAPTKAAPGPVGTSIVDTVPPKPAVSPTVASGSVPGAQLTVYPTIVILTPKPVAASPTSAATATTEPSPTTGTGGSATDDGPAPVPPGPVASSNDGVKPPSAGPNPPVITTGPDPSSVLPKPAEAGAGGASGTRPGTTPVTGSGPSPVPYWLTLSSLALLMCGWGMRRASSHSKPGQAPIE